MAGLGQDQGQGQIETESDALSVGSMITLQGNVWLNEKKREIEQIQQMFNLDDEQTLTQTSLMDINDEEMITLIDSGDGLNL